MGQAQSLQPRVEGSEVHEAVLRVGDGGADVPLHVQEGLGVRALSLVQVVQDAERHRGAELAPHRLQLRQASAPELQGKSGREAREVNIQVPLVKSVAEKRMCLCTVITSALREPASIAQ